MDGEIGRMWGVVFVDEHGVPLPPPDPSRCPACGKTKANGTGWTDALITPNGGISRWACPCGEVWTA